MKNSLASEIEALKNRDQKHPSVRQGHREFRKGRHGKRIIFHHSLKSGGVLLPCEGDIEYRNSLKMEFDNSIANYWLQPFQIDIGTHKYTPDVYLEYRNGIGAFREVKPHGQLENPKVDQLLRCAKAFFQANGYSFEVITEKNLWGGFELANLSYIYGCISTIPCPTAISTALKLFCKLPQPVLVEDFRHLIQANNINPNVVEYLIFLGEIAIDQNDLFSENSLLRGAL